MDIDKQYILGFSISDNGKLQTMSNLQNEDGVTIDMVMNLPKPNGIKYEESTESINKVTLQELQAVTQALNPTLTPNIGGIQRSLEPLVRILNSGVNSIQFQQYPSNDSKARANYDRAKRKFIRMINKHSLTKLNDYMTEQALKNQVTQRALDITLDPRNQLNLQIPIVMTQVQTAAKKSTMGKKEKILNSFNPYAKYLLQYQNMVGKQVIGIAAVSLKVKFAVETYMNTLIDQMQQYLQQDDINSALKILGQIVIKHPLTGGITTLANINFNDVINYLTNLNITSVPVLVNNVPELLINYYSNGQFNIKQCLLDLQMNANATDSSETISELLSSATDNAKELTLAKINATSKFADIYTYLISIGTPFNQIADIMMSPIFNEIAQLADTDIFDPNTWGFNLKNAISFYTNKQPLSFVNSEVFAHIFSPDFINSLDIKDDLKSEIVNIWNSSPASGYVQKGMEITKYSNYLLVLQQALRNRWANMKQVVADSWLDDYDDFDSYGFDEILDEYSDEEVQNIRNFAAQPLTNNELQSIIKFIDYCINRNNFLEQEQLKESQAKSEGKPILKTVEERLQDLDLLYTNVVPALEEQRIMGSILSINQGMKTNAYDKYRFIKNIENFINKQYNNFGSSNDITESFDLMRFLSDEEYRQRQIGLYENAKVTYNILDVITKVPHFNEMFNILYVDNWMIKNFSIVSYLTDMLAKEVLNIPTSKLNQKEYKQVLQYANDVLIINWLFNSKLQFKVPKGQRQFTGYFDNTITDDYRDTTIILNSMENLATFKRVMDTYIIPMLKSPDILAKANNIDLSRYKNNAFIKSLSRAVIGDYRSGRTKSYWRIGQINMMQIDASSKTQLEYEKILTDFNKIKNDTINGWRIADLFYLYNLITNKDSFGRSSMTRLFEDLVSSGDRSLLVNNFYQFLSNLDFAQDKDQLMYNLNDLRYRLADSSNSQTKFSVTKINTKVEPEGQSAIDVSLFDPSYFTFDMPFLKGLFVSKLEDGIITPIKPTNNYFQIHLDSKEAVSAIAEDFNQKAKKAQVKVVDVSEIRNLVPGNLRALHANGFIYNGDTYINLDHASISAPLHEFAHMVLAQLRMNNPDEYYKLLSSTINHPDADIIAKNYPNVTGSDLQEEIFVKVMEDLFNNIVNTKYDASVVFNSQEELINAINDLFKTEIPVDTDLLQLMKTPTDQILYQFISKLFNFSGDLNATEIYMSQRLSTAKYKAIQNKLIEENCE